MYNYVKKRKKEKRKGKALWCGRIGPSCYSTVYEEPGIIRIWHTRQGAEGPKTPVEEELGYEHISCYVKK